MIALAATRAARRSRVGAAALPDHTRPNACPNRVAWAMASGAWIEIEGSGSGRPHRCQMLVTHPSPHPPDDPSHGRAGNLHAPAAARPRHRKPRDKPRRGAIHDRSRSRVAFRERDRAATLPRGNIPHVETGAARLDRPGAKQRALHRRCPRRRGEHVRVRRAPPAVERALIPAVVARSRGTSRSSE
jgi:hypothetical protein